jgi:hypothetical protein
MVISGYKPAYARIIFFYNFKDKFKLTGRLALHYYDHAGNLHVF